MKKVLLLSLCLACHAFADNDNTMLAYPSVFAPTNPNDDSSAMTPKLDTKILNPGPTLQGKPELIPVHASGQTDMKTFSDFPYFTSVSLSGFMDVQIMGNSRGQQMQIVGDRAYLDKLDISNSRGELTIGFKPIYTFPSPHEKLLVIFYGSGINKLEYHGTGDITATDLRTPALDLTLDTSGQIKFSGASLGINYLAIDGGGNATIRNVNTPQMDVTVSNHSELQMSGSRVGITSLNSNGAKSVNIRDVNSEDIQVKLHRSYDTQLSGPLVGVSNIEGDSQGILRINGLRSPHLDMKLENDGAVKITGNNIDLRKFDLSGSGTVEIGTIRSSELHLNTHGDGQISLTGLFNLSHVSFSGNDSLYLYWVSSPQLSIEGKDGGHYHLAGRVGHLIASLHNNAYLDAQYLEADAAFVRASDNAKAVVTADKALTAVANNEGCVTYYNDPPAINTISNDHGRVLRLEGLNLASCSMTEPLYYPDGTLRATCKFPDFAMRNIPHKDI